MSTNEVITLTFSAIAILVSLISSYYQFFWKHTKANFRLIEIFNSEGFFNHKYCYVISNLGNQELYLSSICLLSGNSCKGRAYEPYSSHEFKCEDFPRIIKNGEITPVHVSINSNIDYYNLNEYKNKIFMMFEFVSANGRKKEFLHDITAIGKYSSKEEKNVWKLIPLKGFKD